MRRDPPRSAGAAAGGHGAGRVAASRVGVARVIVTADYLEEIAALRSEHANLVAANDHLHRELAKVRRDSEAQVATLQALLDERDAEIESATRLIARLQLAAEAAKEAVPA